MYTYTTNGSMKLEQDTACKILDKILGKAEAVFTGGTPEEIHHMTGAIKDLLDVMATDEEK